MAKNSNEDLFLRFLNDILYNMRLGLSKLRNITSTLFTKHLFITNTTAGILFIGAGDVIQQKIERKLYKDKQYEVKRTGKTV